MQDGSELSNLRDQISDNTISHLNECKKKSRFAGHRGGR